MAIPTPPIGLRPEKLAEEMHQRSRCIEILEAMSRYSSAGKPVPHEWVTELDRRVTPFLAP